MRGRLLLLVFLALTLVVLGFMLTIAQRAKKAKQAIGPTFIYARGADAQKLDPADTDDGESVKVLNNVCEGLVRFRSGTTLIEPCLAESWQMSADGRVCIFALREGVMFHDGTPLTAETAAWSFRRQMDPNAPGRPSGASFAYWPALYSDIESVRPLDERRLEFRLKNSNAAFLANMAIFPAYLVSPQSFIMHGDGMQRHPVGTGPFRFRTWQPNERIVLEANPDYWGPKPKLARIVFKVVPSNASRLIQIQTGEVHAMDGLDPNDLGVLPGEKKLKLCNARGLNLAYLAFNCRKAPMNKLAFRQAVAMAIQKPALIQSVYRGAGEIATCPLPPVIRGTAVRLDDWPFDAARAKELINQLQTVVRPVTITTNDAFGATIQIETNVTERVELPRLTLHVMTNPRPYLPNPTRAAELIKNDLEAVGLKIAIVAKEWGSHLAAVRNAEHDLALHGWIGDNGDPDNFLSILDPRSARVGSAINVSFLEDEELGRLLKTGREEMDPAKRAKVYDDVLRVAHELLPLVPLAHADDMVVLRDNVEGFVLQPTLDVRLGPVSLK
ncbi:MAG: ABC transporter substrate-binding protein [Verrucomicrobiae bacterium]|nr:ABC transporter substrate-binding protein [Verrucomicrobiae bacterium]